MCGIAGWFSRGRGHDEDDQIISGMLESISHRGPDDRGFDKISARGGDSGLVMGHVRLSILDISTKGHQPMSDRGNNVTIVYNGEVYNAFDYYGELEKDGVAFASHTDTEVLIYLYLKYGIEGMLRRINGMFAFALYDHRKELFYLVRDRMGVKPLYYYDDGNDFIYASEIKAFLKHPGFKAEVNGEALSEFFMYRFVAGRDTLFEGVHCVEAGHYLCVNMDGSIKDTTYWDIPCTREGRLTLKDYYTGVKKSVRDRLLSDVKLGVQLSGGIDSSLALYFASQKSKEPVETFSIVFEDDGYSEKKWIDMAASKTDPVQHQKKLDIDMVVDAMQKVTWHMDAPIAIPNNIGIYWMCREAKGSGVKVLLTGEGADEVFGGYVGDSMTMYASLHPIAQEMYETLRMLAGRKRNFTHSREEHYLYSDALMDELEVSDILGDGFQVNGKERRKRIFDRYSNAPTREEQFLDYKVRTYLIELCMRQDRMGMASSVETRVPFCNYELLEMARSQNYTSYIHPSIRPSGHDNKIPLKLIAKKVYGEEFAYREKSGFPLPLSQYYASERFCGYAEKEILPWLYDSPYARRETVRKLWTERNGLDGAACEKLWLVLAFGIWGKEFIG